MIDNPIWHLMWRDARKAFHPFSILFVLALVGLSVFHIGFAVLAPAVAWLLIARAGWQFIPRLVRNGIATEIVQTTPVTDADYINTFERVFLLALGAWVVCTAMVTALSSILDLYTLQVMLGYNVYILNVLCIYYWLAVMPEIGCFSRLISISAMALFLALIQFVAIRFAGAAVRNNILWSAVLITIVFALPGLTAIVLIYYWAMDDFRNRVSDKLVARVERESLF